MTGQNRREQEQDRSEDGEPGRDAPLADRRPGQGARPAPGEDIAGEREPSPTDPASYDPDEEGDEPPEYPTRA
ncbi:hypothetical protein GCM10027570_53310 [Streptomonospora sediminis]